MPRPTHLVVALAVLSVACDSRPEPFGPPAEMTRMAAAVAHGDPGRRIFLRDLCGGDSWAAFGGCLIAGPVERPEWLARVLATGSHPLWANSPA
jgi:hypothetical protein